MDNRRTPQGGRCPASATFADLARAAILLGFLTSAFLCGARLPTLAQDVDVLIFSTEPGGGSLVPAEYDFDEKIQVRDSLPFCPGGRCFYSRTDPGFRTPSGNRPTDGLYTLAPGTPVRFEIVALDAGVSFKVGAGVLKASGESTSLGTALAMHVHPEYQLEAAEGVVGDFNLSFRLTTTSPQYSASQVRSFTLTNGDVPATQTPSPTPTPRPTDPPTATATHTEMPTATRTPTSTVPPNDTCDGDCNGDGVVSIAELIRGVNIALGRASLDECPAFDINGDGVVSVGELISAVRDALEGCE